MVLGFIANEVSGRTEPGDTYLSHFPEIVSNVSVCPVVRPHLIGKYINVCNAIDNQNRIRKSDIELENIG